MSSPNPVSPRTHQAAIVLFFVFAAMMLLGVLMAKTQGVWQTQTLSVIGSGATGSIAFYRVSTLPVKK